MAGPDICTSYRLVVVGARVLGNDTVLVCIVTTFHGECTRTCTCVHHLFVHDARSSQHSSPACASAPMVPGMTFLDSQPTPMARDIHWSNCSYDYDPHGSLSSCALPRSAHSVRSPALRAMLCYYPRDRLLSVQLWCFLQQWILDATLHV
jgi:hypothetical protein